MGAELCSAPAAASPSTPPPPLCCGSLTVVPQLASLRGGVGHLGGGTGGAPMPLSTCGGEPAQLLQM